jgi:hypothetical protein
VKEMFKLWRDNFFFFFYFQKKIIKDKISSWSHHIIVVKESVIPYHFQINVRFFQCLLLSINDLENIYMF